MIWREYWKAVGLTIALMSPLLAFLVVYGLMGVGR